MCCSRRDVAVDEIEFGEVIGQDSFGVAHRGVWKGEVALMRIKLPPGTCSSLLPTPKEVLSSKVSSATLLHNAYCSLSQYLAIEN